LRGAGGTSASRPARERPSDRREVVWPACAGLVAGEPAARAGARRRGGSRWRPPRPRSPSSSPRFRY